VPVSDVSTTLILGPQQPDGTPATGRFPLIALSHGNGGAGVLYRTIAEHLARNGYVVALPDHPGNTRADNGLAGTVANLESRPAYLQRVVDWAFTGSAYAASLVPDTVGLIGHSLGGYTALALAGGAATALGWEEPPVTAQAPIATPADERVRALVLLAPATMWFASPHALDAVRVPILMITAEHDLHTPSFHAQVVARGIPDAAQLEHRIAAGAGHFSFLDPFPRAMTNPSPRSAWTSKHFLGGCCSRHDARGAQTQRGCEAGMPALGVADREDAFDACFAIGVVRRRRERFAQMHRHEIVAVGGLAAATRAVAERTARQDVVTFAGRQRTVEIAAQRHHVTVARAHGRGELDAEKARRDEDVIKRQRRCARHARCTTAPSTIVMVHVRSRI
jgi:dienelactone hydrolase